MGLDNGIYIKNCKNRYFMNEPIEEDGWVGICYWRKCYGLRYKILHHIICNSDEPEYKLNLVDVWSVIHLLESYNAENWEQSIWTWDEIKGSIRRHINALYYLAAKLEDDPDYCEVYFYDSY